MLTTMILAAAMAASPAAATPVPAARTAFLKCVQKLLLADLEAKKTAADFATEIPTACATERDAFKAALVADNVSFGMKPGEAAEDADDQISDYHDKYKDDFQNYLDTNTRPQF